MIELDWSREVEFDDEYNIDWVDSFEHLFKVVYEMALEEEKGVSYDKKTI